MSTRACVHFMQNGGAEAKIYRHSDGYPEGLGQDLLGFLQELKDNVRDNRFNDAGYLAAKWVVCDATMNRHYANGETHDLNFLGVGVVAEDPTDIEYRYEVLCGDLDANGLPKVMMYDIYTGVTLTLGQYLNDKVLTQGSWYAILLID